MLQHHMWDSICFEEYLSKCLHPHKLKDMSLTHTVNNFHTLRSLKIHWRSYMCSLKPGLGGLSSGSDIMFLQAQRENYKLNIGSWKVKGNKYLLPTEFEVHIVWTRFMVQMQSAQSINLSRKKLVCKLQYGLRKLG